VCAFGSVMFLQENMNIKDGVTTSSKEQLRSLVHVWELDEITPNGVKDRSVTKEHPRGLKRKRPNFIREDPPSWTRGWHRQNGANEGGKVHNDKRTHMRKGATKLGRNGPGLVGPGRPAWPIPGSVRPQFLEREYLSTLSTWRQHHLQRERHSPERSSTS
jgi:hypothetical protein